jgi:hypothetical protein
MKSSVIHARAPKKTLEEIEFLKKDLGLESTTEVIHFALHHLVIERKKAKAKSPYELLEEIGEFGASALSPELSSNYKDTIKKRLKKKHG